MSNSPNPGWVAISGSSRALPSGVNLSCDIPGCPDSASRAAYWGRVVCGYHWEVKQVQAMAAILRARGELTTYRTARG